MCVCVLLYVTCLMPGLSLPQMEASTQQHGMNSGAFLTSAEAATLTP